MIDDVKGSLAAWEDIFSQAIDMHASIMHKWVRKVKQLRWLTRDILDQLSKIDTQEQKETTSRLRFRIAKGSLNLFGI